MRVQYTEQVVTRAEREPDYRKRLIDDPKAAIEEELGIELPSTFEIRVEQERPNEAILVLPALVAPEQLRDEELVALAGGSVPGSSWCGNCDTGSPCGSVS
jgi:hypothetical protein